MVKRIQNNHGLRSQPIGLTWRLTTLTCLLCCSLTVMMKVTHYFYTIHRSAHQRFFFYLKDKFAPVLDMTLNCLLDTWPPQREQVCQIIALVGWNEWLCVRVLHKHSATKNFRFRKNRFEILQDFINLSSLFFSNLLVLHETVINAHGCKKKKVRILTE